MVGRGSHPCPTLAAQSLLQGRLQVRMVLENQSSPLLLHSTGPGQNLFVRMENKFTKAGRWEGLEGDQDPALGSLGLLEIGLFAWGWCSQGNLGDATGPTVITSPPWCARHPPGPALRGCASCPRQRQQPQPGTQSIPCWGPCPWHCHHPAGVTVPAHSLPKAPFPREHFSQSQGEQGTELLSTLKMTVSVQ